MKEITKQMIHLYNIKDLDFMGYKIFSPKDLSYHHNIIARRDGGPETIHNGAILVQHTSHDYLHTIERYDKEIFYKIASEMLDENIKGHLDIYNLRKIRDLLLYFENEHKYTTTKKGHVLIKSNYITNRIDI